MNTLGPPKHGLVRGLQWGIDACDYLRFGFEKYAGPASELWYDDIAIGTQPIGCK